MAVTIKQLTKKTFYSLIFLTGIAICLGIIFRLSNLDYKVFWHDEIHSQFHIAGYYFFELHQGVFNGKILHPQDLQYYLHLNPQRDFIDTLKSLAVDDPHHPPLYYIFARFWLQIFGDNIAILRSFSVFISLLMLPVAYFLSQEAFNNQKISLIFVSLISLSPLFVLYAQEAREYSLWGLLILLSYLCLLKALKVQSLTSSLSNWGLYTLTIIAGLYTSALMILVIFAQFIYVILTTQWTKQRVFFYPLSLSLTGFAFLPWFLIFINNYAVYKAANAWMSETMISWQEILQKISINLSRLFLLINPDSRLDIMMMLIIPLVSLILYAIYYLITHHATYPSKIFLLTFAFMPFLGLLLPDLLFGGIRSIIPRYLIPTWLGLLFILSYTLGLFSEKKTGQQILGLLLFFSIISNIINLQSDTAWTKDINYQLPQVAQLINDSSSPLVVGDDKSYHPGTWFALSYLLDSDVKLQLLSNTENYQLPSSFKTIYLLNLPDEFKLNLQPYQTSTFEKVFQNDALWLWKIVRKQ